MNKSRNIAKYIFLLAVLCLAACKNAEVPAQFAEGKSMPDIYPDYAGVTVPCNIAPLNFAIENEADNYVTRIKAGDNEWVIGEQSVMIDEEDWQEIKQTALAGNGTISIEVFTENGGNWTRMKPFEMFVSKDSIDPYISYRLIAPSYVTYEGLTINQRCLENFDESVIYSNMINSNEKDGQCINCHSYQNYDPNTMQFHVRQAHGGTVIAHDGKIEKLNLKASDNMTSAGVYPAWHPTLPLIAYSTNHTGQSFHTYDKQKIEVQDTYSDLILYDVEKQEVQPLPRDTNDLDCFPFWSPDGKYLYYCSAHYEMNDSTDRTKEYDLILNYQDVHYNLYRRAFDEKTRQFGPQQMVYNSGDTCSATLPRISPDGRYLMFTRGDYGVFHIWHSSSDLYLIDLTQATQAQAGNKSQQEAKGSGVAELGSASEAPTSPGWNGCEARCLRELNSPEVDSYHSWSSNGKWVIFSSRRYDGNFTRPFIAHMNEDGTFTRPFELPQANPRFHQEFLRSYNIPEFMRGPVTIKPQEFAKVIFADSIQAKLSPNAPKEADIATGASRLNK